VAHVEALRPATDRPVREPHVVSLAGQQRSRELKPHQPAIQALRPTACLSVFDGREAVGHVVAWDGRGYEAYLADDTSLGFYDTPEAAVAAISAEEVGE
jgi:hypothetical protein